MFLVLFNTCAVFLIFLAVFNQFPMHFNGDNSCVKLGSRLTNQIARFGGQSGVRIFRGKACDWSCVTR